VIKKDRFVNKNNSWLQKRPKITTPVVTKSSRVTLHHKTPGEPGIGGCTEH